MKAVSGKLQAVVDIVLQSWVYKKTEGHKNKTGTDIRPMRA